MVAVHNLYVVWGHPHVITPLSSIQPSISPRSSPFFVYTPILTLTQTTVT